MSETKMTTSRGLRVLQIVNTLGISDGGPARNAAELNRALNLATRSNLAWVKGPRSASLVQERPREPGRNTAWGLSEKSGLADATNAFSSADIIIIHGYYLWWVPLAVITAKISRKRILLTPHGSLTRYQQQFSTTKKRVFEAISGWLIRRCVDSFAVGSERERMELVERFPSARVAVVGVGTDIPPMPTVKGEWSSPLRLLSLSRIAPKKRIDLMIDALAVLKSRGVAARLSIAGDGNAALRSLLEEQSRKLDLQCDVEFLGLLRRSEMNRLLSEGDVFLAPSDDENFGIAAAEAIAAGMASIVSRHVDAMHGLSGEFLITLDHRTPEAIADAVCRITATPKSELAKQANKAAQIFAWASVADRWRALAQAEDS